MIGWEPVLSSLTQKACSFGSTTRCLFHCSSVTCGGGFCAPSSPYHQNNIKFTKLETLPLDSQCWAPPWAAASARCAPAQFDSCPYRPRWVPGWAASPGRSAPSHPSPGRPPGSPTGTGSPPASGAAHACPAPAPKQGGKDFKRQ